MEKYFAVGDELLVFGKRLSLKPRTIDHPETEKVEAEDENWIHLNRITPIYPLTEGLPQRWLRSLIWRTLEQFESAIAEPLAGITGDSTRFGTETVKTANSTPARVGTPACPESFRGEKRGVNEAEQLAISSLQSPIPFLSRREAVRMLHFPETLGDTYRPPRRLALDDFVELQRQVRAR